MTFSPITVFDIVTAGTIYNRPYLHSLVAFTALAATNIDSQEDRWQMYQQQLHKSASSYQKPGGTCEPRRTRACAAIRLNVLLVSKVLLHGPESLLGTQHGILLLQLFLPKGSLLSSLKVTACSALLATNPIFIVKLLLSPALPTFPAPPRCRNFPLECLPGQRQR